MDDGVPDRCLVRSNLSDDRNRKINAYSMSRFLGIPPFVDATPHMDQILANKGGLPQTIAAQTYPTACSALHFGPRWNRGFDCPNYAYQHV